MYVEYRDAVKSKETRCRDDLVQMILDSEGR